MKKALLFMGLLCSCIAAKAQDLPSISSATYGTPAPPGGPNTPVTVEVLLSHVEGLAAVHVLVTIGGDTLHEQEFSADAVVAFPIVGPPAAVLRFFTAAPITGATISVQLGDGNGTKGPSFAASPF